MDFEMWHPRAVDWEPEQLKIRHTRMKRRSQSSRRGKRARRSLSTGQLAGLDFWITSKHALVLMRNEGISHFLPSHHRARQNKTLSTSQSKSIFLFLSWTWNGDMKTPRFNPWCCRPLTATQPKIMIRWMNMRGCGP